MIVASFVQLTQTVATLRTCDERAVVRTQTAVARLDISAIARAAIAAQVIAIIASFTRLALTVATEHATRARRTGVIRRDRQTIV
jgi:hypothetical protein